MSRKRKLKKQQKRRAQWVENLEDLYLRQADETFLEAARPHFRELETVSLTGLYGEVVDRALAGALTGGDPARVAELLALIRRGASPRPLVLLAEAVDLLAKGRREPAAARLAALGEAGEAALGAARHLPEKLRALAHPGGLPASEPDRPGEASWRGIGDLARLSRALEAPKRRLPRSLELEGAAARAVWSYYRALAAVTARGFRPGAKTLATLARATATLRGEAPAGGSLERLLRETDQRLQALTALHDLEQSVRRSRRPRIEERLLEKLPATGLSARLLRDDPPALLRPLQHALRTRWRGLLELVFERRGAVGLGVLLVVRPGLLAMDLDVGAGLAEVAKWAEAKALIESESFGELAAFLSSASARVEAEPRLAALWSLELWARHQDAQGVDRETVHVTLERLCEMAAAVGSRFAAGERPVMARYLRAALLELCDELKPCGHFLDGAEALLEYLGEDAALLALALAAAVSSGSERSWHEHAVRIVARGPAPADRDALLRVAANIASDRPKTAIAALSGIKPLFAGADWGRVLDRVAPELAHGMLGGLVVAADVAFEDPGESERILGEVRRELELCRPLLGEQPEIVALEVAVDSWGAAPAVAKRQVRRFLRRFEGLEPALLLYRQALDLRETESCPDVDEAIVGAVVDRLDGRLLLWIRYLPSLVKDASPELLRRLARRTHGLSKDEAIDEDGRRMLVRWSKSLGEMSGVVAKAGAASIQSIGLEVPEPESDEETESRPGKRRRPRSRPVDDRQLDLFAPE